MNRLNKFLLLSLIGLTVAGATAVGALHSQEQGNARAKQPQKSREMVDFENKFPVADNNESEPIDLKERQKRQAKGRKYDEDKSGLAIEPNTEVMISSSPWAVGLPAIPADQSTAIIIGTVAQAQAHLSANRQKVYSEFTIDVEDILKNDNEKSLRVGATVDVDRIGGRVKLPNGKVGMYWVTGQSMPKVGGRYLLFLTQIDKESGLSILTGYELRNGNVVLLDNPGEGHPISSYQGADETTLLHEVRATIIKNQ